MTALSTMRVFEARKPGHPLLRDHPGGGRRLRHVEAASGKPH